MHLCMHWSVRYLFFFPQNLVSNSQSVNLFHTQFGGKWYRVGLAYDSLGFARYRSRFRISMGTLTPRSNGDAELTMYEMG